MRVSVLLQITGEDGTPGPADEIAAFEKTVERPEDLRPALERAFSSGRPALVNVLTDPSVVYPRRANLA